MKTYNKLELPLEWEFVKDKRIEIMPMSNEEFGVIYIIDQDDEVVKMIGYELIKDNENDKR